MVEIMNFGTETIGFNALRVLGLFGMSALLFSITVLPLAVIVLKVYEKFQKNKEPSSFLYILLSIVGIIWGGVGTAAFLPYRTNLLVFILPVVIGCFLGYMCKFRQTILIKIIFLFLIIGFIASPIVVSFVCPPSPFQGQNIIDISREKVTAKNLKNIREAISVYCKENRSYPAKFDKDKFVIKDMPDFPMVLLERKIKHPDLNKVFIASTKPNQKIQPDQITDEGGWIYSPDSGDIRINCSHKDSKGVSYYEW